jgi:hypothetical protein
MKSNILLRIEANGRGLNIEEFAGEGFFTPFKPNLA